MDIKGMVKLVASAVLVGGGIGFLIGRREVYNMAARCDELRKANKLMQDECDDLELVNKILRRNRQITEVASKGAIDEFDDGIAKALMNDELE